MFKILKENNKIKKLQQEEFEKRIQAYKDKDKKNMISQINNPKKNLFVTGDNSSEHNSVPIKAWEKMCLYLFQKIFLNQKITNMKV